MLHRIFDRSVQLGRKSKLLPINGKVLVTYMVISSLLLECKNPLGLFFVVDLNLTVGCGQKLAVSYCCLKMVFCQQEAN